MRIVHHVWKGYGCFRTRGTADCKIIETFSTVFNDFLVVNWNENVGPVPVILQSAGTHTNVYIYTYRERVLKMHRYKLLIYAYIYIHTHTHTHTNTQIQGTPLEDAQVQIARLDKVKTTFQVCVCIYMYTCI
jgi:hypothetical protein